MKRQYLYLGAAAVALGALNLWQWLPQAGVSGPTVSSRAAGNFQPEDFRLKMSAPTSGDRTAGGRNLFQARLPPPPPVKKVVAPAAPPPKSPEQLAEEAARAELAQIRLVGVVFRGERGQAFLVKGDSVILAQTGDKVGDRFVVESIGTDSVRLKDATTNVSGQIPVSGK